MKRRKRFTIRLIALGFAVAAFTAGPAQARIDEGLNGLQKIQVVDTIRTADDVRVAPVSPTQHVLQQSSGRILSADDMTGRVTPGPGQPSVSSSDDDGFTWGTVGMSGFVLLLGALGAYLIVHQSNKGKLANA